MQTNRRRNKVKSSEHRQKDKRRCKETEGHTMMKTERTGIRTNKMERERNREKDKG
jgi:hypothetical protein